MGYIFWGCRSTVYLGWFYWFRGTIGCGFWWVFGGFGVLLIGFGFASCLVLCNLVCRGVFCCVCSLFATEVWVAGLVWGFVVWSEVFGGFAIRLCFGVEPAFLMWGFSGVWFA